MIVLCFVLTWLRLKSGSLWTGVILHASSNHFIQQFFAPMTAYTGRTKYILGEFGIGFALVVAVLAAYFWMRRAEVATSVGAPSKPGFSTLHVKTQLGTECRSRSTVGSYLPPALSEKGVNLARSHRTLQRPDEHMVENTWSGAGGTPSSPTDCLLPPASCHLPPAACLPPPGFSRPGKPIISAGGQ